MKNLWGHAAMMWLGVSLTVGFYEGRRLVRNTAKALTAASALSASARHKVEPRGEEVTVQGVKTKKKPKKIQSQRPKVRKRREALKNLSREEKIELLRAHRARKQERAQQRRERRLERRDALLQRGEGLDEPSEEPLPEELLGEEGLDEELLDDELLEEELLDTGLLEPVQ